MEIELSTEYVPEHFNHNAGSMIPPYWKAVVMYGPDECDGAYGMGHTEQDAIDTLMMDLRDRGLDTERYNYRMVS